MQSLAVKTITALAVALLALIVLLPTPQAPAVIGEAPGAGAPGAGELRLIRNARVWTGERFSEPQDVTLLDGHIQAVGAAALGEDAASGAHGALDAMDASGTVIDAAGRYLLPGLIDAHTHTYGTARRDALRFGVTTQLDMFMDRSLLDEARKTREQSGSTQEADLYSAGMLATAPGGHGTQYGVAVTPLTAPEQAEAWVAARKAEGSDYIKLVYIPGLASLPSLDRATARAVIKAAHGQGLMAVAHVSTQAAALAMVEDGIDGLVHVFADTPATEAFIDLARDRGVFVIPTLAVIAGINGRETIASQLSEQESQLLSTMQQQGLAAQLPVHGDDYRLETALENVRRLHAGGIPILAGSDAPNPGTAHGVSLHQELQLLVEAGLARSDALASATVLPAETFKLNGRGVIAAGARADLLLLENNPLDAIANTMTVAAVIKNGYEVDRRRLLDNQAAAPISKALLGDFEDGLLAPDGLAWGATDDGMTGGASRGTMERVAGGKDGSAGALRIDATVQAGFAWPWAGAGVMGAPVNIEGFSAIRFAVRGTPGSRRLMAFHENLVGAPATAHFDVTENWQTVTIPFSELDGTSWRRFIGFAFVDGPEPVESTMYLDDVTLVP